MQKIFVPKCCLRYITTTAVLIALTVFNVVLIQKRSSPNFYKGYKDGAVGCHYGDEENLPLANYHDFLSQKQIFFQDTSCKGGLDSRQACAVESAAKVNRDWDINVFFVGPPSRMFLNSTLYKALSQTKNINFYRVIITTFSDDTPMRRLSPTEYGLINLADMLRYLTLYKYGGVYFDLDVISVKSLDAFPRNWVAMQCSDALGSGALGLAKDAMGQAISEMIIQDFNKFESPFLWSEFSAGILTRALADICVAKSIGEMSNQTCPGIIVLNRTHFYPVHHAHVDLYLTPSELNLPHTYGYYLWSKASGGNAVLRGSMLANLARKFCPVTYHLYGDTFGY